MPLGEPFGISTNRGSRCDEFRLMANQGRFKSVKADKADLKTRAFCIGAEMRSPYDLEFDQVFSSLFSVCALMRIYSLASLMLCSEVGCIVSKDE